jgi:hypothetical protein
MTNQEMIAGRYLRWHTALQSAIRIQRQLASGGTVVVATYTKATRYGRQHAYWFQGTPSGLYVKRGNGRVCIDYAAIRMV